MVSHLVPLLRQDGRVIIVSSTAGKLGNNYSDELKARFLDPHLTVPKLDALAQQFIADVRANQYTQHGWPASTYKVSKALVNGYLRVLNDLYKEDSRKLFFAALCPGWVRTRMGGEKASRDVTQGAETPVYLSTTDLKDLPNGKFWYDKNVSDY